MYKSQKSINTGLYESIDLDEVEVGHYSCRICLEDVAVKKINGQLYIFISDAEAHMMLGNYHAKLIRRLTYLEKRAKLSSRP